MKPNYLIDFDSTLVTVESLDELARIVFARRADGDELQKQLETITAQGMNGEIPFDVSLQRRLALFAATQDDIDQTIELLQESIAPSVLRNRDWFAANAERIYIISGGFEEIICPVTAQFGIPKEHVFANSFTMTDGVVSGCDTGRLTSQAGGKVLQARQLDLPHPLVMIGDGYTDYEVRKAGIADAFWTTTEVVAREKVLAVADKVLTDFDAVVALDAAPLSAK